MLYPVTSDWTLDWMSPDDPEIALMYIYEGFMKINRHAKK